MAFADDLVLMTDDPVEMPTLLNETEACKGHGNKRSKIYISLRRKEKRHQSRVDKVGVYHQWHPYTGG